MLKKLFAAGWVYISVIALLYGFTPTAKGQFLEEMLHQAVEAQFEEEAPSNISSSLASLKALIRKEEEERARN